MIAPPTADTASFAGQARLRLEQEGCAVLPTSPDLIDRIRFADVEEAIQKSRACLQLIGVQDAGPERCAWAISSMAEGCGLKQVFWKPFDFPLACLDTMPTYRSFVESLGQLPPAEVDDVVKELVDFIDSEANEGAGNGPLAAYIEVPPDVIETYEHLYARLDSQDCVLYPRNISLDPDVKVMDQDQTARKLIYPSCDAIVFYYCMEDRLNWLTEAYISCERTVVQIRRAGGLVPKRIVVDLVGETDRVANDLGFPVIPWSETGRPDKLWQRVREIAS